MNNNTTRPQLRLLGGGKAGPRPPARPVGAQDSVYRALCARLTIAQAIDVASGRAMHGCTAAERNVLRLVIRVDEMAAAA